MNPDGTLDTPRMPVAEHRRQLANTLFQLANGFGQIMRGVADAAGPLAGFGPVFAEAVDPRRDTRPDADRIFNPAFVDVPGSLKQSARNPAGRCPSRTYAPRGRATGGGTWPSCHSSARRRCWRARPTSPRRCRTWARSSSRTTRARTSCAGSTGSSGRFIRIAEEALESARTQTRTAPAPSREA